ncbi:hypothetical protein [Microbacterium murale]|uniref:SAF domain-containing protein n=1 Tax=Microbacterium murale TaxID=1081040 RepID=A0ABU0P5Z8_9MICO|nr:hypothetical protein [Microbacterium murale]MDQ0642755.1 hypothetical protein [Microbacterium murale]
MTRVADVTGRARSIVSRAARTAVSRRLIPVWITGGAIAVLVVTVIAFGGLDRSDTTPTPLSAGDEVRMPLYAVTVLGAELTDEVEEQSLSADPGETLVVISLQLENLTNLPIGVGRGADMVVSRLVGVDESLLSLPGVESAKTVGVWRGDGSAGSVVLQPGVPSEVTIAWIASKDAFADGVVNLDVYDAVETRGRVILSADHINWVRGDLAARITVDAEEGR